MNQTVTMAVGDDGIALVTIDVQGRPMNVLTPEFHAEMSEIVQRLASDAGIKGAVFTSHKTDFMAGADLKWILAVACSVKTPEEAWRFAWPLNELFRKLETCGKPCVAAINGTALGGGLELALACHHRVAADNPATRIGLPEVLVGLLPGAGGTQRLSRMIGVRDALQLIVEGTHLTVAEAAAKKIVDRVVPAAQLIEAAKEYITQGGKASNPWDEKGYKVPGGAGGMHPGAVQTFMGGTALVSKRTLHNYPAPMAILSAVYEGTQLPIDAGLKIESRYLATLLLNPVARNMIRTLFVNKGAAEKGAGRPAELPKSEVKTLGMLGAGMMGAGIAYVSARAGITVKLLDATLEKAQQGKAYGEQLVAKDLERGRTTPDKGAALLARIQPAADYADLKDCDFVVEAVFEDRTVKAEVTRKTEAVVPASTVFASNTSTLPITSLAKAWSRPADFIGVHFFSPAEKMPLVEIIKGKETSPATVARALDYVIQLRKTPIVVNDGRGFYTSRVFGTFTNEGMTLLAEGVKPALIENAAKFAGMAVGPLAVLDEVSIELAYHVTKQAEQALGSAFVPPSSWPVIRTMIEDLKRPGKRHGRGFYDYPKDAKKHLWAGLAEHFPLRAAQPELEEVKTRLLYIQALETARCLEEGVLTNPIDADLGSILGWGFPAWTGGTLSFIDTVGVANFVATCERLAESCGPRFQPSAALKARAQKGETYYA
ncbi:MAG TPA: 3-hydroxyacyl-CoA dehydrogenase NAD-binding domain-containing protein [Gammaproteobacteria bacterium]|nr:3-hydroxyacyl-CoA dehydrogenase NAD-binding domain-containing protein [Gammaproteobacteria bacterium]